MFVYLFFICLVLLLLFFRSLGVQYNRQIFLTSNSLLLIFVSCFAIFRFDVGWDYVNYYTAIDQEQILEIIRFEPLSIVFCLVSLYFESPPLIFILFGLPTYVLIYFTLNRYSALFCISFMYFISFIYLDTFSYIRQFLAVSITFYGLRFIEKGQFVKYFIICVVATLFHYSAIFAVVIYFIYRYFSVRTVVILIFAVLIFKTLLLKLLEGSMYAYYLDKLEDFTGGGIVKYVNLCLALSLIIIDRCFVSQYSNSKYLSIIIIPLILPFILGPSLGARLGSYFSIYMCLYIGDIFNKLKKTNRLILCLFYIFSFSSFFLLMIYIGSKNDFKDLYTPYRLVFFVNDISFK